MDSPPASPRSPTPPLPPRPDDPEQPSGAERRYPLRSTRADNRAASGSSHAARRNPVRSTRAPSSTPSQRGRALESAPAPDRLSTAPAPAPPSRARTPPPAPPSRARTPPPAPTSPARTAPPAPPAAERTPAPAPPAAAQTAAPAPPSSARRAPPTSAAPTAAPTSAAPTAPPTSAAPTAATSFKPAGRTAGSKEDADFIKIDMEQLHTVLDTLGVSDDERKSIISDVLSKCQAVYKLALDSQTNRCMPMVQSISALQAQCDDLGRVLGENYALNEEQKRSESLPKIEALLMTTLRSFDGLKKERLNNLQAMQLQLIDLWDSLGVTLNDQKEYRHMTRYIRASVDEVTETNALSTSLLSEIQSEVNRLEGRLMQQIGKNFAVLAENLRQTHLSGCEEYGLNFATIDVQEGRIDILSADNKLKQLVLKLEKDMVRRADIIDCAETIFKRRKEHGYHEEDEAGANSLVERVKVWEVVNKTKFFYDKGHIIENLLKPETLRKKHAVSPPAAAAEKESPSVPESEDSGSDESGSEQDPDFVPSDSEDEF